jgi:hypothetical protein
MEKISTRPKLVVFNCKSTSSYSFEISKSWRMEIIIAANFQKFTIFPKESTSKKVSCRHKGRFAKGINKASIPTISIHHPTCIIMQIAIFYDHIVLD